jgi:hypothetical protein
VRSRPPASSPLTRPGPGGPCAGQSRYQQLRGEWGTSDGPPGSEVNDLTLGPLRLLGPAIAGQARACPCMTRASLSLPVESLQLTTPFLAETLQVTPLAAHTY